MVSNINIRFLDVIKEKGYTGYRLAKEVDEISESKLTHIRRGVNEVSQNLISALLKKFPDVNATWLLTGKGEWLLTGEGNVLTVAEVKTPYKAIKGKLSQYKSTIKENIKEFLKFKGITQSVFYEEVGITTGSLMPYTPEYDALALLNHYPEISPDWLFFNKGNMLKQLQGNEIQSLHKSKTKEIALESQDIPLYDVEVTAGVVSLFKNPQSTTPIDTVRIPNMPKCDGAITITGDSMYPLVKSGDMVFYKTISDIPQSIYYGNMYIISINLEGNELVMLKYIQKGKDEKHILLASENKHHQDKEIHIKQINGLALVKGSVRFNFTT